MCMRGGAGAGVWVGGTKDGTTHRLPLPGRPLPDPPTHRGLASGVSAGGCRPVLMSNCLTDIIPIASPTMPAASQAIPASDLAAAAQQGNATARAIGAPGSSPQDAPSPADVASPAAAAANSSRAPIYTQAGDVCQLPLQYNGLEVRGAPLCW